MEPDDRPAGSVAQPSTVWYGFGKSLVGATLAVVWACPLSGVAILFLAGLLTFDTLWLAFLPAATYLAIHGTEGAVTPLLLARRFELNPVLVIISLVFWFWMWGIPGAILSVPMLAITKIICDRVRPLAAFGHFLEG